MQSVSPKKSFGCAPPMPMSLMVTATVPGLDTVTVFAKPYVWTRCFPNDRLEGVTPSTGVPAGDVVDVVELGPVLVVVGGGVSKDAEHWLHLVEVDTPLVTASLLNRAGVVGAALLAAREA